MPAGYRPVSSKMYVFSNNNGQLHHNACMILAHGEQVAFGNTLNRTFQLSHAQNVHFYAPHGHVLNSSFYSLGRGARRANNAAAETLGQLDDCYDYNLTKFTGYHTKQLSGFAPLDKLIDTCWEGQRGLSYDDLLTLVADPTVDVDVVSVRYRMLKSELTLSKCLSKLWNAGYNYQDVHCSFCRNSLWQAFKGTFVDVPTTTTV